MVSLMGLVADWRACLAMEGADVRTVLQGVVTNDVDRVRPGQAVYAALLTPQGKYLHDFFLSEREDGAIRIDCAAARSPDLVRRLKMYCLRRDARIAVEPDVSVALAWMSGAGEETLSPPSSAETGAAIVVKDPRAAALGIRVYAHDPAAVLQELNAAAATQADYSALRIAAGVPESDIELVADDTYVLEAGFERLNGVDFRKGCYVGQEVTARMKHKTTLRKGLVRVSVDGEASIGSALQTAEGKPVGVLFSQAGGQGLAHVRFDRADGVLQAGEAEVRLLD
ncbi:MAG: folate-binding protein [Pseudomonadota bacterium]